MTKKILQKNMTRPSILVEILEPRFMMSADVPGADILVPAEETQNLDAESQELIDNAQEHYEQIEENVAATTSETVNDSSTTPNTIETVEESTSVSETTEPVEETTEDSSTVETVEENEELSSDSESVEDTVSDTGEITEILDDSEVTDENAELTEEIIEETVVLEEDVEVVEEDVALVDDVTPIEENTELLETTEVEEETRVEIVFVNDDVTDYQELIDGIEPSNENRTIEVVVLDSDLNGIEQVSEVLSNYSDIDAIHIISHGSDGAFSLGEDLLKNDDLLANNESISLWSNALSEDADILLYGCNISIDGDGEALTATLSELTGADVASSTDKTGSTILDGDWELEYSTGLIESSIALSDAVQASWNETLTIENLTGTWSIGNPYISTTAAATPVTVDMSFSTPTGTIIQNVVADNLTTSAFFSDTYVEGADSIYMEILWDTTPEAGDTPASDDAQTITVTFTFDTAVVNPILHIDKFGGRGIALSNSSEWTVTTSGATLTQLAGVGHLNVTADSFYRTAGETVASDAEANADASLGTAAGSIQINGTYTTLTFDITALGNEGGGGDGLELAWELEALNEAPINSVPTVQTINEDTTLVFNTTNGNLISISDGDAGASLLETTISVNNGILNLSGTTGLTFVNGSDASSSMTVSGTLTDINAALDGLNYVPTTDYNGSDTFSITTIDAILVSLNIDANLQVHYDFEDVSVGTLVGDATIVTDLDRGEVLSLDGTGDYFSIDGLSGTPQNATLSAWVNLDLGADFGDVISLGDSLVLRVDGANGVSGTYYNGLEWVELASDTYVNGSGWVHVAYSFDDTANIHTLYLNGTKYASSSTSDSIVYNQGSNTVIGAHGNGDTTYDFQGQIDNAYIFGRVLTAEEIATLANDIILINTDTVVITVDSVNDAPVNIIPIKQTVLEETQTNIVGITVNDVDANASDIVTTELTVTHGILDISLVGATTISEGSNSSASLTLSGTISDINATLTTLNYTGNLDVIGINADTLTIVTNDEGNTGLGGALTDTSMIQIDINNVNDAPILTALSHNPTFTEGDANVQLFGFVTPDTIESGQSIDALVFTVDNVTDGNDELVTLDGTTFALVDLISGTSVTNGYGYSVSLVGTTATVTLTTLGATSGNIANLGASINYRNNSETPTTADRVFTITSMRDSGGTANGGVDTSSPNLASTVTVIAVNDDPFNNGTLPTDISVTEDISSDIDLSSIDLADPDANGGNLSLELSTSTGGILTVSSGAGIIIGNNGTSTITINGTLDDINAYLAISSNIQYLHPSTNFNGDNADTIQVSVNDLGNTGNGGGTDIILGTVNIGIAPVNDAPIIANVQNVFINEIHYDNTGTDTGEAIEIAGIAGQDMTGWSLVLYNGNDGLAYDTTVLSGTIANQDNGYGVQTYTYGTNGIQNDMDAIALVDDSGNVVQFISYEGSFTALDGAAIGMTSTDIGVEESGTTPVGFSLQLNGTGTSQIWTAEAASTFGSLNTTQDFTGLPIGLGSESVLEDTTLVMSSANANAITISDIDAGDGSTDPMLVTLSVNNGTLTLGGTVGLLGLSGDGTSTIIFSGSIAEVNMALEGLIYQGILNYTGTDTLTVFVDDQGNTGTGGNLTVTGIKDIIITPINDAPVLDLDADDSSGSVGVDYQTTYIEGTPPVLIVDSDVSLSDVDNTNLTSIEVTLTNEIDGISKEILNANIGATSLTAIWDSGTGILTISGVGTVAEYESVLATVTYENTSNNPDTTNRIITFIASDGTDDSILATTTVSITNIQQAPTAAADTFSVDEGSLNNIFDLAANDLDLDGDLDISSITIVSGPTNGSLIVNADGTVSYSHDGSENAVDSFTYTINDLIGATSNVATVNITVTSINDAPILDPIGNQNVDELTTLTFTATASDADLPADTLTYTLDATSLAAGMRIDANTGVFTWTPSESDGGSTPSVTITVTDNGTGNLVDSETFTITVNDINTAPIVIDDSVTGREDTRIISTINLLGNDTDIDGDILSVVAGTFTTAHGGTLVLSSDGSYVYTPVTNFHGIDTVNYTVTDGIESDTGRLTIYVQSVNDAPEAVNDTMRTNEDSVFNSRVNLSANDIDFDGDRLSISAGTFTTSNGGTLVIASNGSYVYTPVANFYGIDTVNYTLSDGILSDTGTLTIRVDSVNDAPILEPIGSQDVNELTSLSFTATATDIDAPVDTLTYSLDTDSIEAGMRIDANTGLFSWNPTQDQTGSITSVTITVTDSGSGNLIDSETLSIEVIRTANSSGAGDTENPSDDIVPNDEVINIEEIGTIAKVEGEFIDDSLTQNQALGLDDGNQVFNDYESINLNILNGVLNRNVFSDHSRESYASEMASLDPITIDSTLLNTFSSMSVSENFYTDLDKMYKEMDANAEKEKHENDFTIEVASGISLSLTAGFVAWLFRSGSLIASLFATMPVWRDFDPVSILSDEKDEEESRLHEEESQDTQKVEQIFENER